MNNTHEVIPQKRPPFWFIGEVGIFGRMGLEESARLTMASRVPRDFCRTILGLPSTRAESTA